MKVGFISLGCPKNLVDSEVMIGMVRQAGHELTPVAAEADVLVVNTCAFIDSAKQESVDAILDMARHKRDGRCTRLVVTGCLAERYRDELRAQIPEIDAVLGTGEVPGIVGALDASIGSGAMPLRLFKGVPGATVAPGATPRGDGSSPPLPDYLYDGDTPRNLITPGHYAYMKVAEGCDYSCSFCIIPTLRGHYRSRSTESLVAEARRLVGQGVRELILISQDTTFYGVDRGERGALAGLMRALNAIEGLEWIRLLYLYPTTIGDDTLAAMAECAKVCKYVDLPLQHASDSVLKRMKRPGTGRSYRRLLDRIRTRVPGVALRTTFIVGFPGETQAEFDELKRFVREIRFDHVGVFTYSHEEGTSAFRLSDHVAPSVKRKRQGQVMAIQRRLVAATQRRRIGERVRVLIDGPAPDHGLVLRGRLSTQSPDIDSCVYLTETDPEQFPAGSFLEGEVADARGYDLIVRPLPDAEGE
jgi:ribosomal protein S12 methylthiotransferase